MGNRHFFISPAEYRWRLGLVALCAFLLGGALAQLGGLDVPQIRPEVLYTLAGVVGGAMLFGFAQYATARAASIRADYRRTPSTADDAAGEERAVRWDAIAAALQHANVPGALGAFFALHNELEGEPHKNDPRAPGVHVGGSRG